MTRKCIIPGCGYIKNKPNNPSLALFRCPKNVELSREWAASIGIPFIGPNQHVCERHFEDRFISRKIDKSTGNQRTRLSPKAIPTIFHNNIDYGLQYPLNALTNEFPTYFDTYQHNESVLQFENRFSSTNNSNENFEVSKIVLQDPPNQPKIIKNSMSDVVKDLKASEQLLMEIKKEEMAVEEMHSIKVEPSEGNIESISIERKNDMQNLTVNQYLKYNYNYLMTLLPSSWSIHQLPVDNDEVFAFSKECTVKENGTFLSIYTKNIVINKDGKANYSLHGKKLNNEDQCFPKLITNVENLLKVISEFDEVKVCKGLMTNEFDVDKDDIIYKDDVGLHRHVDCCLISDQEQCDTCYNYTQYLLSMVNNRKSIIGRQFVYNQIY